VAFHRPYTLAEVRRSIDELADYVHAAPETLRRKIKTIVPEYAAPGLTVRTGDDLPMGEANPVPQRRTNITSEAS
jgi:hypothetical protein